MDTLIPDSPLYIANPALSHEQALVHASDLLRCALASAAEHGESLDGPARDLFLSVGHLISMAKVMVDRSLDALPVP